MTKKEHRASKLLTKRIRELEEIIAGTRDRLSSDSCGLCNVYGKAGECLNCPVFPCNNDESRNRRYFLTYSLISQNEIEIMARQHLKWLLATVESNGWECDYETN